jgi:toxin ParE1/3/4
MACNVAPRAEADLDDIWLYAATESGSMDVATRLVASITDRFCFLAGFPHAGRSRARDFGAGMRSFPVGEYVIVYSVEDGHVFILRVVHGRRDFDRLFEL